jgi:hypothetical protein
LFCDKTGKESEQTTHKEKNKATKYTYQNQEVNTEFLQLPAQA